MQLKCPGCSRTLKVPDTAAGKVVKCPCGKQLRAPGGKSQAGEPSQGAGQPKAQPSNRPAPQQGASDGGFGGVDAMMFDELTDSDMQPVSVPTFAKMAPTAASNPYASPAATGSSDAGATPHQAGPYASQNLRLANYLLDIFLYVVFIFGLAIVIVVIRLSLGGGGDAAEPQEPTPQWVLQATNVGFFLLYFALPEAIFGATAAKFLTGTRVVSADGSKANFGQILIRTFARMIPFEPLSFVFGDKTTGWHDSISKTRVITVRG